MRLIDFRPPTDRKRGIVVRRGWGLDLIPRGQSPEEPSLIQSATIEANGTVLSLVMNGVGPGTWASYGFASATSAEAVMSKVALATTAAGFDRVSGQASANPARSRNLIALKPLRKTPIVPTSQIAPHADVLDEIDNGNGTRTVRLRLSKPVYAGNPCQLSLAAGWRTGASAQASVAVTNNSALAAAPVVGGRWIVPPKQRVTGPFWVEIMAGSINPEGRSGLAGVRFTATDGTTTKTAWASLGTSTDGRRCWRAQIDPAGLNPGQITVHKDIYPWIGSVRSSGSGQGMATSSWVNTADAALMMAYDPAGTRYAPAFVACDPVSGTTTASAAMVQSTLAGAKAVAAASKPRDVTTAMQAIYLANRSAAAANGGAALTRMADGAKIVIPAGTTPMGSTAITTGLTTTECWCEVIGDPDLANPRASCFIDGNTTTTNTRLSMLAFRNVQLNVGGVNIVNNAYIWIDNTQVEARTGQGASTAFLTSSTTSYIYVTGSAIGSTTAVNFANSGSAQRFALVRSSSTPRQIAALAIVGCTIGTNVSSWVGIGDADSTADWICVDVTGTSLTTRSINFPSTASGGYSQIVRPLLINVLVERIGADPQPIGAIGENATERATHMVIENCSFVGERLNLLYNDPADLVSDNVHTDCRIANTYFDWLPTKHDDFFDDTTSGTNGGAPNYGYRPSLTSSLWVQDGCGFEGNVHARRLGSANFQQHGYGIGAVVNPSSATGQGNAWPKFTNDRSAMGANTGGGDYRPASGSPLIGVAANCNLDTDRAGVARGATFAAGALEAA